MVIDICYLSGINLLQRLEVLQRYLDRQLGRAELYNLHGFAMMRGSSVACLHSLSEIVLYTIKDNGCMVYGVYVGSEKLLR